MHLDSAEPSIPYRDFVMSETRFSMLWQTNPETAEHYLQQAQLNVKNRYRYYKQLSELTWSETTSVLDMSGPAKTDIAKEKDHG